MHWLSQSKTNGQYHAFAAPFPPRGWHGGPFPPNGELAQRLSLTMRPTRTASPLCLCSPQWPETFFFFQFLFEYSGPLSELFSKIRLDIWITYLSIYLFIYYLFFLFNCEYLIFCRRYISFYFIVSTISFTSKVPDTWIKFSSRRRRRV